jgi:uncharacterized protein
MNPFPTDVRSVSFRSAGDLCDAELHVPRGVEKPPIVVMAHGLGALREFGLVPFAQRFAQAGLAVLVFDYRCFGASEGQPRYLIHAPRHIEDYLAAIDFAVTLPEVDGSRLGLWGTSYSGGHVLVAAARRPQVRAVVSQVPFVDGIASMRLFPVPLLPLAAVAGVRDGMCAILGRPPYYAPIVAERGLRVLAGEDCATGYHALVPADTEHPGTAPARIFLTLPLYRPIRYAPRVQAKVLVIAATKDTLIPVSAVRKTAARLPHGEIVELPLGHFEPYVGEPFERVVTLERDFFLRAL